MSVTLKTGGFEPSPDEIVQRIKDLLGEQYKEGSLLRELAQNADDADSTILRLVHLEGTRDHPHPLLQGPALIVLNDGFVTEDNLTAIHQIGMGSKTSDANKIGKFGLGMKSVFHWCEAFYFAYAARQSLGTGSEDGIEFLNPWDKTALERDWSAPEYNDRVISTVLGKARSLSADLDPRIDSWFCLWIPLRQPHHHLDGAEVLSRDPSIEHPRLDDLTPSAAADVLPLLRHLRRVERWAVSAHEVPSLTWVVTADDRIVPSRLAGALPTGTVPQLFEKAVIATNGAYVETYDVYGLSASPRDPELQKLRADGKRWPKRAQVSATRDSRRELEIGEEVSVALVRREVTSPGDDVAGAPANRRISLAEYVYLPLGTKTPTTSGPMDADYRLILHGTFFLNTSRTELHHRQRDANPSALEYEWNERLEKEHLFPMVLRVLAGQVEVRSLPLPAVQALTECLAKVLLFHEKDALRWVTRYEEWIPTVAGGDGQPVTYSLVAAGQPYLELPSPPRHDLELPGRLFPRLREVAGKRRITFSGWPRISSPNAPPARWPAEVLRAILDSLVVADDFRPNELSYVAAVMDLARRDPSFLSTSLLAKLREILDTVQNTRFQDPVWRSAAQAVLEVLPSECLLVLDLSSLSTVAAERCSAAAAIKLPMRLLIPPNLTSASPAAAPKALSTIETELLTTAFAEALPQTEHDADLELAAISCVLRSEELGALRSETGETSWPRTPACFRIKSGASTRKVTLSALMELADSERLVSGGTWQSAVLEAFHDLFSSPVADSVGRFVSDVPGKRKLRMDRERAMEVIRREPVSEKPTHRRALLRLLLTDSRVIEGDIRLAARYLLHGARDRFNDDAPMFCSPRRGDDVWARFGGAVTSPWQILPSELQALLSQEHEVSINVVALDCDGIMSALASAGPVETEAALKVFTSLKEDEIETVLIDLLRSAPEGWKHLPFHETDRGNRVPFDPRMLYLGGTPPKETDGLVELLRPPSPALGALYRQRGLTDFGPHDLIRALLRRISLRGCLNLVLGALADVADGITDEEKDGLRKANWLPLESSNRLIRPDDVISLPRLETLLHKGALPPLLDTEGVFERTLERRPV